MSCRVCGCTDEAACVLDEDGDLVDIADDAAGVVPAGHTTCSWVEPDLCSACVADKVPALLFDVDGKPLRGAP